MTIYADTRQKFGKHDLKHIQIEKTGHKLLLKRLDVGDYMCPGGKITVDTKQDLQEIYSNIFADHARFMREVRRARTKGLRLVVLIEHGNGIRCLDDVCRWDPGHGVAHGRLLADKMRAIEYAYGVRFEFCNKSETGKRIVEILGGYDGKRKK